MLVGAEGGFNVEIKSFDERVLLNPHPFIANTLMLSKFDDEPLNEYFTLIVRDEFTSPESNVTPVYPFTLVGKIHL
jgi:hypothetical protein